MKKLLFIAAIAGAALVSCTKNEVAPSAGQNEITFTVPVVGLQTKAPQYGEIDGIKYPEAERFQVYSVWHLGDFAGWGSSALYMDQVECGYDTDCWKPVTAEGKYYWPKEGKLTFAAYSPADLVAEGISYGAKGLTIAGFAPGTITANQFDLLYGERTYNQVEANYTSGDNTSEDPLFGYYKGVDIEFHHALSQVEFYFYSDVDGIIDLKSVTIQDAQAKGTFKENIDETTPGSYTSTPAWEFTGYSANKADYNIYTQSASDHLSTTPVEKHMGTADCMILPQSLDGVTLNIEYAIKKGDGTYLPQNTTITLNDKKNTASEVISTWEMGKRYKYTIKITLDEIYFDPAVVDWIDVDMSEIIL